VSKETYTSVKRDPTLVSKETCQQLHLNPEA
jgi:hypothetical protein